MTVWERIGAFTIRRARPTLVAVAATTALFAALLPWLRVDTSFLSFVRPETRALVETVEDDFGEGAYLTLIFESRSGRSLLEPDLLHQQLRIVRAIRAAHDVRTFSLVEGIDRGLERVKRKSLLDVHDYADVAEAILGLAGGRTVRDLMKVSTHWMSDPDAIAFYAHLRIAQSAGAATGPGASESRYRVPQVRAIRALVRADPGESRAERRLAFAAIRADAEALATPDLAVHVLSDDLVAYDIDLETQKSVALLGAMVLAIDLLCVLLLLRSARETAIVFTILAVASIWTFGLAAGLGIELSFLHVLVLPILLGTGIDDALVFGRRFAEESRPDRTREQVLLATFAGTGRPIFLTTLTTFVAFVATGLTARADVFASFFLLVAAAMAFSLAATLVLEGALRSVWSPAGSRPGTQIAVRGLASPLARMNERVARVALRIVDAGARPVIAVGTVALILSAGSALRLDSEMARGDLLQPGMPSFSANEAMQQYFGDFRVGYVHFGGEVANPELIWKLRELERRLTVTPEIEQILGAANVDSIVGLLEKLGVAITRDLDVEAAFERVRRSERTADYAVDMTFREAVDYVVHRDGSHTDGLLLRFFVSGEEASRTLAAIASIEREIEALGLDRMPGVDVRIGGGDVIYPLESTYYVETLIRSFFLSLAGNVLVLAIAWRRLGRALLATTPIIVSAAIVLGAMPLFGMSLNALNLGISAILVGIGIDYPIHWLERYDEERTAHGRTRREAARVALETMGPHLFAGMATTAIGFGASTVLLLPMSTSFGLTMAAAIVLVYGLTIFGLPPLAAGGTSPERERAALQPPSTFR